MRAPTYFKLAADVEFEPYAFPAEDVLAGDPDPHMATMSFDSATGVTVFAAVLAMKPATIRAEVAETETIHILEGEMHVTLESGEEFDAKAGDAILLPAGTKSTREIKTTYKEFTVLAGGR